MNVSNGAGMRIAITGATGLIGRELARQLSEAGHHVEAWTRSPENARGLFPSDVQVCAWDPSGVPRAQLSGLHAIIHLAGESVAGGRWTDARKTALERSRIESSRSIIEAIAALPRQERPAALLSASAIGFYGDRADEELTEEASPGKGFMPDLCAEWERRILAASDLGVRTACLRVGVVLAPDGGMLGPVLPLFRCGLGGRIGSGQQWMSWIHVEDVARLFVHALENPDISGPINAVAPNPVRNTTFTKVLAKTVGRPALLPAPKFALRLAVGEMAEIMTGSQRVLPAAAAAAGFEFRFPTLAEALDPICAVEDHVLRYEQRIPLPLDETFAFFADPRNLERITPPFLNFAITSLPEGQLEADSIIRYKLRLHGVPIHWRTRIDRWDPPHAFVDIQERGPYRLWHHTHEFESDGDGTIVRDRIRYRLPFGSLGSLIAGAFVTRDLAEVFRYRHQELERILTPHREAA